MSKAGRFTLCLVLIALAALLIWPVFIAGLWVGLLALLIMLGAAVILAIRPRSR